MDDVEDNHYCLNSGETILGIANYIGHRKELCDASPEPDKSASTADDFFSSLELQSSSKSSTNLAGFQSKTGIVTRSKSGVEPKKKRPHDLFVPISRTKKIRKNASPKRPKDDEENFADKAKEEEEWVLFPRLGLKRTTNEEEDKLPESKKSLASEQSSASRYTPELFSMSPILMGGLAEDKDEEVAKFLEESHYDETLYNFEEMEDFGYGPLKSSAATKSTLSFRTSPSLWPGQTWDSLLPGDDADSPTDTTKDSKFVTYSNGKWRPLPTGTKPQVSKVQDEQSTCGGGKWKPIESAPADRGSKWDSPVPPVSHTGGKWKPIEAQEPTSTPTGGKWKPISSPSHTGGKWKPISSPSHTGGKWKPISSPSHTGGKWKADEGCADILSAGKEEEQQEESPPTEHTRGKWVPGVEAKSPTPAERRLKVIQSCRSTSGKCLKTAGGYVQYFCSPCNRRLASKEMYKKHVRSELHFKRVLQDNDLEFNTRSLQFFRGLFAGGYAGRGLGKRNIKKPERYRMTETEEKKKNEEVAENGTKRVMVKCGGCRSKLWPHQLGKHLVSYYHTRRAIIEDPQHKQLVLDNIHAVCQQAPFQCAICRFYCNTTGSFKAHWRSREHKAAEHPGGILWCSFCKYECEDTLLMELHLDSNYHREVIFAINKSMPIVIRQRTAISCSVCPKVFRYNRGLALHYKKEHEEHEEREEPEPFLCPSPKCKFATKSRKSLQRHLMTGHKKDGATVPYFCSACDVLFSSADEAKHHRRTRTHKMQTLMKRVKEDTGKIMPKYRCVYCSTVLLGIDELKEHINEYHQGLRPKCAKCGSAFALSQELSRHVRDNACSFDQAAATATAAEEEGEEVFKCTLCPYTITSKSEFLFHSLTHKDSGSLDLKLQCPLCDKLFRKNALKVHLRTHTNERPYACHMCDQSFRRVEGLDKHYRQIHSSGVESSKASDKASDGSDKQHKTAPLKVRSPQRKGPHEYPCEHCHYIGKTSTLLRRHNLVHEDRRGYPCRHCSFKARLPSHLKRHLRVHTGAKPYKCPHCEYACNNLENLRKHVMYTSLHPKGKLYNCMVCSFSTNENRLLKKHLTLTPIHRDTHAEDYKAIMGLIYDVDSDHKLESKPPTPPPKVVYKCTKTVRVSLNKVRVPAPVPVMSRPRVLTLLSPRPQMPSKNLKDKRMPLISKNLEDKRKVLEMELKKLKKTENQTKEICQSGPTADFTTLEAHQQTHDEIDINIKEEPDDQDDQEDQEYLYISMPNDQQDSSYILAEVKGDDLVLKPKIYIVK